MKEGRKEGRKEGKKGGRKEEGKNASEPLSHLEKYFLISHRKTDRKTNKANMKPIVPYKSNGKPIQTIFEDSGVGTPTSLPPLYHSFPRPSLVWLGSTRSILASYSKLMQILSEASFHPNMYLQVNPFSKLMHVHSEVSCRPNTDL